MAPLRVAVVGSGVAGISATWLLNEHSEHSVELYEAADYIGGHTHTVQYKKPGNKSNPSTPVDTGFIVCNPPTYPNFLAFLRELNVKTAPTTMTFSVSRNRGEFEWAGKGAALFCQARNLLNPRMYRMVWDILRFNALALKLIADEEGAAKGKGDQSAEEGSDDDETVVEGVELSIGDFIKREGLSDAFRDDYLLPMTAAIWSTPPDKCGLDFPAKTLVRFMHNHHLLQVRNKPLWLVVKGGSSSYIPPVISKLPPTSVHTSTPIRSLRSTTLSSGQNRVVLTTESGEERVYDHVVMACHADETLRILGDDATQSEKEILGGFEFSSNSAVLHGDKRLMPVRRKAWSAWNYLTSSTSTPDGKTKANVNSVSLTYNMNALQHIDESVYGPVLVTLNPPFEPDEKLVVGRWDYDHPMYTAKVVHCQKMLPTIQNKRGVTFVGAWTQYGFHEDGFSSSLRTLTTHLPSVKPPFPIRSAARSLPSPTETRMNLFLLSWLETLRRLLSLPFSILAFFIVLVLDFALRVLPVYESLKGERVMEGWLEKEMVAVREFWRKDEAGGGMGVGEAEKKREALRKKLL